MSTEGSTEKTDLIDTINNALDEIDIQIHTGKVDAALKSVRQLQALCEKEQFSQHVNIGGFLADIGEAKRDSDIITEAIEYISKAEMDKLSFEEKEQFYYGQAKAYDSLFVLMRESGGLFDTGSVENNRKARELYYKLLELYTRPDAKSLGKGHIVKAYINLANHYDHCGRNFDALHWYDKALQLDSTFGMALGNKGIALERLGIIYGHSIGLSLLVRASRLLEKAIASSDKDTPEYAKTYFRKNFNTSIRFSLQSCKMEKMFVLLTIRSKSRIPRI